jgi:hypothetical protein
MGILARQAHHARLKRTDGLHLSHQLRPGRRRDLKRKMGGARDSTASGDQSSAGTNIQGYGEVEEILPLLVHSPDEQGNRQRESLPVTAF